MGLISRVSSRTYREVSGCLSSHKMVFEKKYNTIESKGSESRQRDGATSGKSVMDYRGWRLPFGDVIGKGMHRIDANLERSASLRFWNKRFPVLASVTRAQKNRGIMNLIKWPLAAYVFYQVFKRECGTQNQFREAEAHRWAKHEKFMAESPQYKANLIDIYKLSPLPAPRPYNNQF